MKRTTIILPDDLALRLRLEAGRRGASIAEIAREAIESKLGASGAGNRLGFIGVGDGDGEDDSERIDELVRGAIGRRFQADDTHRPTLEG
ncbi:MAG: CopG family transcriptional regulator [Candidatus Dormibacteria bacterium]